MNRKIAIAAVSALLILSTYILITSRDADRKTAREGMSTAQEARDTVQRELHVGDDVAAVEAFIKRHGLESSGFNDGLILSEVRYAREDGPQRTIVVLAFVFDQQDRLMDFSAVENYETDSD